MNAIGLNPIKLDAIGLDPIRMNAIRLGVPVASSGSGRPYIDPELLSHVKMAISTWGKTNDDPDRAVLKDLTPNGNDMRLLNFGFTEGSGYGLPGTDFEGWLCTDGVDDMIVSEKTVDEMIGDSKECTVISIINYISDIGSDHVNVLGKRFIRNNMFERNGLNGKYYICGYTSPSINEIGNVTVVNDILGDKNDFTASYPTAAGVADYFSVIGYLDTNNVPRKCVKIAYAGGFIANKVLTTDEINQIIAYYNLDRPGQIIKPQLYYNIKKQGITNENHAEFNDQLIDFVGGHNIQLNNIGWEGESGINSYPVVFGANKTWDKMASSNNTDFIFELTGNSIHLTKANDNLALLFTYVYKDGTVNEVSIPTFKLKVTGLKEGQNVVYNYVSEDNVSDIASIRITEDGEYVCPKSTIFVPAEILSNVWIGFKVNPENIDLDITIEVLPTIEHALSLDGINDFGKVTGLPVLKDYTVVAKRKWLYGDSVTSTETGSIVSKSKVGNNGAFILEQTLNRNPSRSSTFSFGTINSLMSNDKLNEESFTYQTKYSYNGNPIQAGAGIDSDSMWLGTIRDGDSRFSKLALWSLMLFPYSLSEFLLERQLRKYKAGTLYPDMIEFRPIVKSNIPYSSISYSVNPGVYVTEGSTVTITITLSNASDKLVGVSSNAISDISISGDNGTYEITGKVTKSPQKISIVISSYLTMLGNETLISNETLIKNE
ncbi:hypothetical protein NXV52_15640 [Bacteroides faecis]|uniref:hypothetical protein n=1 Tax=Bacteroides faecis TaxID=674529 RepID=UPI0021655D9E|nr:hypothetical protein [Bacteroides faecis]MCS3304445.1 hypothetical protein [Bacteroides faecis]